MSSPAACISMQAAATLRFTNFSPIIQPTITPRNWPAVTRVNTSVACASE